MKWRRLCLDEEGVMRIHRTKCGDWPNRASGLSNGFGLSPPFSNCIRNLWMSQQQSTAKPSLQGVRIKARKGAVKAHAKHEPTGTSRRSFFTQPLTPFSLPSIQRSALQAPRSYPKQRLRRSYKQTHPSRLHLRVPQVFRCPLRHPHCWRASPAWRLVP